jgi:hypothetical protein
MNLQFVGMSGKSSANGQVFEAVLGTSKAKWLTESRAGCFPETWKSEVLKKIAVIDQTEFESLSIKILIPNLGLNLDPDLTNLNPQNCLVQIKASIEILWGVSQTGY